MKFDVYENGNSDLFISNNMAMVRTDGNAISNRATAFSIDHLLSATCVKEYRAETEKQLNDGKGTFCAR